MTMNLKALQLTDEQIRVVIDALHVHATEREYKSRIFGAVAGVQPAKEGKLAREVIDELQPLVQAGGDSEMATVTDFYSSPQWWPAGSPQYVVLPDGVTMEMLRAAYGEYLKELCDPKCKGEGFRMKSLLEFCVEQGVRFASGEEIRHHVAKENRNVVQLG